MAAATRAAPPSSSRLSATSIAGHPGTSGQSRTLCPETKRSSITSPTTRIFSLDRSGIPGPLKDVRRADCQPPRKVDHPAAIAGHNRRLRAWPAAKGVLLSLGQHVGLDLFGPTGRPP